MCYRGNTLHYLLHGCHHKHPMDGLRLVFPPAATAILCVPVCLVPFLVLLLSSCHFIIDVMKTEMLYVFSLITDAPHVPCNAGLLSYLSVISFHDTCGD